MRKRLLILAGVVLLATGVLLALILVPLWLENRPRPELRFSDGRVFRIEGVSLGTNHVIGVNDWWNIYLRKFLPYSIVQKLTPARGQSRDTTDRPALVVWVHAYDAHTRKYVDCQGLRASFVDEHGDVYPASYTSHGAFSGGFNRQAYISDVFPRRSVQLKLELTTYPPQASVKAESHTVLIDNPARATRLDAWTPQRLPATRRIGELEFTLDSLTILTNGGPKRWWEATSLHWQPEFKLTQGGQPAADWETPEWEAVDVTGNRGQTLGLHEPVLKFIGTIRPLPQAVTDKSSRWRLPLSGWPSNPNGIQWNTNRIMHGASVDVIGLFPPGAYTFSQGQLTNLPGGFRRSGGWTGLSRQVRPGVWQSWRTHTTTNYAAYIRRILAKPGQRIALGVLDAEGQAVWGDNSGGEAEGVLAFVFYPPPGMQPVALEVIVLDPVQAEFVVAPPSTSIDVSAVAASVQYSNVAQRTGTRLDRIVRRVGAAATNAPSPAATNGLLK